MGMRQRGIGQIEQQGVFAAYALEIGQERLTDLFVGLRGDAMNDLNEQFDGCVDDLLSPQMEEGGQHRVPDWGGVAAQLARRLRVDPLAVLLEDLRRRHLSSSTRDAGSGAKLVVPDPNTKNTTLAMTNDLAQHHAPSVIYFPASRSRKMRHAIASPTSR
jgi:hypothetical protein